MNTLGTASILLAAALPTTCESLVTGSSSSDPTFGTLQSETSLTLGVNGSTQIVSVAYNDRSGNEGLTSTDCSGRRYFKSGYSALGNSWADNINFKWTKSPKVRPPAGWATLMGDPAVTGSRHNRAFVYASNLAVPIDRFTTPVCGGPDQIAKIAGACIARSSDWGKTFTLSASDCLRAANDVYDGGDMASGADGKVYAAYLTGSATMGGVDVYMANSETAPFQKLQSPFPNIGIAMHPLVRVDELTDRAYVGGEDGNGGIWLSRLDGSTWTAPKQVNSVHKLAARPVLPLAENQQLRTGRPFSFDVGRSEQGRDDSRIRVAFTARDCLNCKVYLRGARCDENMNCQEIDAWSTSGAASDQFNPNIVATFGIAGFAAFPIWKVSYLSRQNNPSGRSVSVMAGDFTYNNPPTAPVFTSAPLVQNLPVCPDSTYWGDYDGMVPGGFNSQNTLRQFVRGFTDSRIGPCSNSGTFGGHQHVSLVFWER